MLIGLQSCSLQIHTCLTSWYHLCVCWGGECAHVPMGAHTGMCLWTRTIQFGQPWKVAWMKGTAFRDVSSQIKALQRRCDFCGLVLWSFPKQFLVAEKAVSKSSWKHFSEPCSWIQIITCACLCVCVWVSVCVWRHDSATGHSRPKRPLKAAASTASSVRGLQPPSPTKQEGNHSLTRRKKREGSYAYFWRERREDPGEVWTVLCEVIFTIMLLPWRRRKLTLVGTCLADTACQAAHARTERGPQPGRQRGARPGGKRPCGAP